MDRKKGERADKSSDVAKLKKDLTGAATCLQSLSAQLDNIGAALTTSMEASAIENRLKEQVSRLQNEIDHLKESDRKNSAALGDIALKFAEDLDTRAEKIKKDFELKLQEHKNESEATEKSLRDELASEKTKNAALKDGEGITRRQLENQMKKVEDEQKRKENEIHVRLTKTQQQLQQSESQNRTLSKELDDQQTISRGREREFDLLSRRLAGIEAFQPLSLDCIQTSLKKIQEVLQGFCKRCVEKADFLPWNRTPNCLQRDGLPPQFKSTPVGLNFIAAAIQDAIVTAMSENIFVNTPYCPCSELKLIAEALYRDNRAHEAIWRLMAANTVLAHSDILKRSSQRLKTIALDLLKSWEIFDAESLQELHAQLTRIFVDSLECWMQLMSIQDKIYIAHRGMSGCFNDGSNHPLDDTAKVPGGFATEQPTRVLCLFPAFLQIPVGERTMKPMVLYQGTALNSDSRDLLDASNECSEVQSPRITNRKFSISSKGTSETA